MINPNKLYKITTFYGIVPRAQEDVTKDDMQEVFLTLVWDKTLASYNIDIIIDGIDRPNDCVIRYVIFAEEIDLTYQETDLLLAHNDDADAVQALLDDIKGRKTDFTRTECLC